MDNKAVIQEGVDTPGGQFVWTTRYQNKSLATFDGAVIRITVGAPRFALGYKIGGSISELAPYGLFNKGLSPDEFERQFLARLDDIGFARIAQALDTARSLTPSGKVALACFEDLTKPGQQCHRTQVGSWLRSHGVLCSELPEPVSARTLRLDL
jgi:hypothetical protein